MRWRGVRGIARPVAALFVASSAMLAAFACRTAGAPAPASAPAPAPPVTAPAAAAPAPPATPPPAPPAPAADASVSASIVRDHCLTCHGEEMLQQQRLTAAQWTKTIVKMQGWGSTLPQARVEGLAASLAREYGRDAGRFAPQPITAQDAAAIFEPSPAAAYAGGDRERGRALYADRCEACHAEDAGGGEGGINIVGRRILDRPADLADLIRKGRGDMPSFDETTDAEVADLVAYLRSLPGATPGSAAQ